MSDELEKFGKSRDGNFEAIGFAAGPENKQALIISCKADPNDLEHPGYMNSELRRYLDNILKMAGKEHFTGFVFKKAF